MNVHDRRHVWDECSWQKTRVGWMFMTEDTCGMNVHERRHVWDECSWQKTRVGWMFITEDTCGMNIHDRRHVWDGRSWQKTRVGWMIMTEDTCGMNDHDRRHVWDEWSGQRTRVGWCSWQKIRVEWMFMTEDTCGMNVHDRRHVWDEWSWQKTRVRWMIMTEDTCGMPKQSFNMCCHVRNSDNPPALIFSPSSINSRFAVATCYLVIAVRTKRDNTAATAVCRVDCVDVLPEASSKCKLEIRIKWRKSKDRRTEGRSHRQLPSGAHRNIERRVGRKRNPWPMTERGHGNTPLRMNVGAPEKRRM